MGLYQMPDHSLGIYSTKKILGCSSITCNEAVREDMGLDSLKGKRINANI